MSVSAVQQRQQCGQILGRSVEETRHRVTVERQPVGRRGLHDAFIAQT